MSDPRSGFDHRNFVNFDNTMPENPKAMRLSDAAFRALFDAVCYCSRQETDGEISQQALRKICRPKVQAELVANGNLEPSPNRPGDWMVHDYLRHQRSKEELDYLRKAKSEGGQRGMHARWHIGRRRFEPTCDLCQSEFKGPRSA